MVSEQDLQPIAVVMVPLPAQGHLNPLLHLSGHLATRRIPVHYVSSSTHIRQARHRLHGWNLSPTAATSDHLHFHDIAFPSLPSPPRPPPRDSLANKFPAHLQPSFDAAASHLLPHLSSLILSLSASHARVVLLHDSSMSFATSAASPRTESFAFHTASAISNLFFAGKAELCRAKLSSCFSQEFIDWVFQQRRMPLPPLKGRVFNTCVSIEGRFLKRFSDEVICDAAQRMFAVGPLNPIVGDGRRSDDECLKWLDRQCKASVVYVSFGTTTSMSREQAREIAAGLEASGRRFVWVKRKADRCDIFEEAGEEEDEDLELAEWEERVKEKGIVVRGWAPQLEILAHQSTGCFLSHCGWNSCMEAMSYGVPILAWPLHSDQPANTVLVTEILRVGMPVREWSEKDEVVPATAVKEAVVRLMDGDEGREVRKKARETGEILRAAVAAGGSSKEDLDAFVGYISRP